MEDEIAAIFDLIDRVLVVKPAVLLFLQIQGKTKAGTVDPALADLAQPPYSPGIGQGVCDFRQVKLVDRSDAVRLTSHPASDSAPAWSPDGRHIAFVRDGTIFLIAPLGGAERKVANVQAFDIAWTREARSSVSIPAVASEPSSPRRLSSSTWSLTESCSRIDLEGQ